MHIIDIYIMKLASKVCTIKDFLILLNQCDVEGSTVDVAVVNGNKFYFPEGLYNLDMESFPLIENDPDSACTPIICTASGDNYFLLSTAGENFVLNQHTSITSALIHLDNFYKDVRILDAVFRGDNSAYLIKFNGNSSN